MNLAPFKYSGPRDLFDTAIAVEALEHELDACHSFIERLGTEEAFDFLDLQEERMKNVVLSLAQKLNLIPGETK